MAPKKAGGKAAAKAGASGKKAAGSSPAARWVSAQVEALAAQRASGPEWLAELHEWHEDRLGAILSLIEARTVTELPEELREGVEFYISQFADGADTSLEAFYDDRDMYGDLGAPAVAEAPALPWVREPVTEDAEKAVESLEAWSDTSPQGFDRLMKLLQAQAASPWVQEAGLRAMCRLVVEGKKTGAKIPTLQPGTLARRVELVAGRFGQDFEVKRQSMNALGAMLYEEKDMYPFVAAGLHNVFVRAINDNIQDQDTVLCALRYLVVLARGCPKHSPELSQVVSAGTEDALRKIILYHETHIQMNALARTTIPFLRD